MKTKKKVDKNPSPELIFASQSFTHEVQAIVDEFEVSMIEAVVSWCEKNNKEIEYAAELIQINQNIMNTIHDEGVGLKMFKKNEKRITNKIESMT